ncbi:MAG TPA: iron dependent repressor, metal binding and dimerization domain protein [Candidatus Bathyarchaeia archaeon]|nr:iron dependent repressor, metal binding and dimerization domain protein [Candidatus Bathyarchaeia archaeon]
MDDENTSSTNITSTIEDYLERVLFLSEKKGFAKVTEIANDLNISKASVTEMISKLKNQGFVDFEKYGTITLTNEGKKIASKIKDRHILLESFLKLIGVCPETASKDCCVMEHDLSKETITSLKNFISFLEEPEQRDISERFKRYLK